MLSCVALILNHNGRSLLPQLFDSLVDQDGLTAICLIDNASTDDSVSFTRQHYPAVEVFQNSENLNYGTAYNRAIRTRTEDVMFIVNNDVVVHPGAIRNALNYLEHHPDVASVSFEGLDRERDRPFPVSCPPLRRFGKELSPARAFRGPNDTPIESPCYLWGAACCIRAEMFRKIEFDEAMDWGFEDVDLGWSITRLTGMRNVFLPSATIYHLESRTAKTVFKQRQIDRMSSRNAMLSFAKNASAGELFRALPFMLRNFPFVSRRWDLACELGKRLIARSRSSNP